MGKGKGILFGSESGDLLIQVRTDALTGQIIGGVVIGDVVNQNQAQLLTIHPGEIKPDPLIGVGISDMVLDNGNMLHWRTKVRQAFEADGMKIKTLQFDTVEELYIDAKYS